MSRKGAFQFNRMPGKTSVAVPSDIEAKLNALEERAEAKGNAVGGQVIDMTEGTQGSPKAPKGPQGSPGVSGALDASDRVRMRSRDGVKLVRKNLRLPEDVVEQLEEYCKRERWTAADVVAQALGEYFAGRVGGR